MAQSKRAKAAIHTKRDERGRFTKHQDFFNFFGLPLELRCTVYKHCFSWENQQPTGLDHESENTLALKLQILRSSKAVFAEALPVFWRSHFLRIRMSISQHASQRPIRRTENLDWFSRGLSHIGWVAPMKRLLTKLELMAPNFKPGIEWDDVPVFACILLNFPNLRLLRLTLTALTCHGPSHRALQRLARPNAKMTAMMVELWTRLDRLEIIMCHREEDSLQNFREAIGPSFHWDQEIIGKGACGCMRSIWSLQQSCESLAGAKLAREASATNRWSTYAHIPLEKPETRGKPCWARGRRSKKIGNA